MKVIDIFNFLNSKFPCETAQDFDNVGLLIGDALCEVTSCIIALDCTKAVIEKARKQGANLIVTHHPVIFEPLKALAADSIPALCIKNGLSVICMHTNMDVGIGGVNDVLCEALSLENVKNAPTKDGYVLKTATLPYKMSADELAEYIGKKLGTAVRYTAEHSPVETVTVCSGSGGSFFEDALSFGTDAFITGDIKHNVFLAAVDRGITLIDAGHFYTEDLIVEPLCEMLKNEFSDIKFTTDHTYRVKLFK